MRGTQAEARTAAFTLQTERVGPLPIVNHVLHRLDLPALLARHVPTTDARVTVPYAHSLGILLRSLVVEREPIYRQGETVRRFAAGLYGVPAPVAQRLDDDQIGRALDRLFAADRTALLTDVVVAVAHRFGVQCDQLHNDSTTIRFCGQYRAAGPDRSLRGRRTPWITYGHSKDHRPDLKQLLFVLTTSADGGIPVQFRCADGNTADASTHIATWETLRRVAGRADFLYVADSKLCTREAMDHLDRHGGRFVTVLPRTRLEDTEFRRWIQTHTPPWTLVWDRPHPRRKGGPRDRWYACHAPLPSREAWPVVWVWSPLLALHHEQTRRTRLAAAIDELTALQQRLRGPKARLRQPAAIDRAVQTILTRHAVARYLTVRRTERAVAQFRQARRGRPGPATAYRKITRVSPDLDWQLEDAVLAADRASDGMYPLLTNDKTLTPAQVLEAHKGQPTLEKRFQQTKTVHEIAPVFLKNAGRIEALFTLYFLALLVQALIERELRGAMRRAQLTELPLYPEERRCKRPTTEQILRLFSHAERHVLLQAGQSVQTFHPDLTDLQKQVLTLLGVPERAFRM